MRTAIEAQSVARVLVALNQPLAAGETDIESARPQVAAEQEQVVNAVDAADFQVLYQYRSIPALAGTINRKGVQALAANPNVEQITIDGIGDALGDQLPRTNGAQLEALGQSVSLIHADEVQAAGITGAGVTVAVLDSGIDTNNVDLQDSIAYEKCFLAAGGCPTGAHPAEDDNGHGTNVAGIITSNGQVAPKGVAPDAKIAAYKILTSSGLGQFSDWIAALDDIATNHPTVRIVNMSLQSTISCPGGALSTAIDTLRSAGIATFIASGNSGTKNSLYVPACITAGISVGATYDANIGSVSGWKVSCTDQTTRVDQVACWSSSDDTLALLAPGARITSTGMGGGLSTYMGTSQATPHAAAEAALLLQAAPGITVDDMLNRMKLTGTMVTDDLHDNNPLTNRQTPRIDARVALVTDLSADYDHDGCPNGKEFGPNPTAGGLRNPLNPWDYFNPTHDGVNGVDDIMAVVAQYHKDKYLPSPPNPPNMPNSEYNPDTDRTYIGPNPWNLGPPDGLQRVGDILAAVAQFGHNCS